MRVIITKAAYDSLPQRLKDQLPAAPTEGATMKDSHGQTAQDITEWVHRSTVRQCADRIAGLIQQLEHKHADLEEANAELLAPTIVQDYREYTADEIVHIPEDLHDRYQFLCSVPVEIGLSLRERKEKELIERVGRSEKILRGIVKFTERSGWGDPANLGHWLGAAQRWAVGRNE